MTDRELVALAATAAGINLAIRPFDHCGPEGSAFTEGLEFFDPLNDNGDALRLLVLTRGEIGVWGGSSDHGPCTTFDHDEISSVIESHGDDAEAATRRAIVRGAAELGAMP